MADLRDLSPKPAFLRALQNQRWTVSGAISELVDNSFGFGRGDATEVHVIWNSVRRVLAVLDNGKGMDDASRLFQLGNTIGRAVGDIGEYGSGGTMALVWLGRRATVWTLKDGKVSSGFVDWNKLIREESWGDVDAGWYRATASNTATDLLALGGGTLVRLEFPPKRHVDVSNIKQRLATTYGPALRHGRRLVWHTIGKNGDTEEELAEYLSIPNPQEIVVSIEVEGQKLSARGQVGVVPGLTISQSGIGICFGPRLLKFTKDCYRSPDGTQNYAGIGVAGYVDLDDGWQPFLSTTKSSVDDGRAWAALMDELFIVIQPLLEQVDRQRTLVLLDDLALELKEMFNSKLDVRVDEGGRLKPDKDGTERIKGDGHRGDGETKPSKPASRYDAGAVELDLTRASDYELSGLLCRIDVQGEQSLVGFINDEHPFVENALVERPPNRSALHKMVVDAIAASVLDQRPDLLGRMFPPKVVENLEDREPRLRHGYLVRLLIDRIRDQEVAS